jgi:hypothetical protein
MAERGADNRRHLTSLDMETGMNKQTKKLILVQDLRGHTRVTDSSNEPYLSGEIVIGRCTAEFEIIDDADGKIKAIAKLEDEKNRLELENSKKITEINIRIEALTASKK